MLVGCILASLMLIHGVTKGRPGYLMPYMGLQVFAFCISCLIVFTCFSYAPDVKRGIAAKPDSMPLKSYLMNIDNDRLMLSIIMFSVLLLVFQAYFMAVVWSCYKYLSQTPQEATHGRRRPTEEDLRNPEDAELLLPPKYEDIVSEPEPTGQTQTEPAPPPYHAEWWHRWASVRWWWCNGSTPCMEPCSSSWEWIFDVDVVDSLLVLIVDIWWHTSLVREHRARVVKHSAHFNQWCHDIALHISVSHAILSVRAR